MITISNTGIFAFSENIFKKDCFTLEAISDPGSQLLAKKMIDDRVKEIKMLKDMNDDKKFVG